MGVVTLAIPTQAACVGYFANDGVVTAREWANPYQNFDNVGRALLSLFVAVTLNGYSRESCWIGLHLTAHLAISHLTFMASTKCCISLQASYYRCS